MLLLTSLDLVCLPFLGFDAGLGASSHALGCGDSATSHKRNCVLVLTVRAGALGSFTEGMSGPWDVEQERGHHKVWP